MHCRVGRRAFGYRPYRAAYTEGFGEPPVEPRVMVSILLYGYTTGVRSSRVIARKS